MFVRKLPPPALALHRNARTGLPLQRHFVEAILAKAEGATGTAANGTEKPSSPTAPLVIPKPSVAGAIWWVAADHAKRCGQALPKDAVGVSLPLPQHWCANETLMMENSRPRVLYPVSTFADPDSMTKAHVLPVASGNGDGAAAGQAATQQVQLPRCGLTGKYFVREEVADNLIWAAQESGFRSPFWLSSTHPQLGPEKYLQLKSGACGIFVSLTAVVFRVGLDFAPQMVDSLRPFWHPTFASEQTRLPGMNIFTGEVSVNAWLRDAAVRNDTTHLASAWVSLDQLRRLRDNPKMSFNLPAFRQPAALPAVPKSKNEKWARPGDHLPIDVVFKDGATLSTDPCVGYRKGTLIEIAQWEMYNAEELVQPGRLATERAGQPAGTAFPDDESTLQALPLFS